MRFIKNVETVWSYIRSFFEAGVCREKSGLEAVPLNYGFLFGYFVTVLAKKISRFEAFRHAPHSLTKYTPM